MWLDLLRPLGPRLKPNKHSSWAPWENLPLPTGLRVDSRFCLLAVLLRLAPCCSSLASSSISNESCGTWLPAACTCSWHRSHQANMCARLNYWELNGPRNLFLSRIEPSSFGLAIVGPKWSCFVLHLDQLSQIVVGDEGLAGQRQTCGTGSFEPSVCTAHNLGYCKKTGVQLEYKYCCLTWPRQDFAMVLTAKDVQTSSLTSQTQHHGTVQQNSGTDSNTGSKQCKKQHLQPWCDLNLALAVCISALARAQPQAEPVQCPFCPFNFSWKGRPSSTAKDTICGGCNVL